MATNKQEQARAVYELWEVILQHRWRFVLPAFAATALVLFAGLFLPRKYEAVAYFERRNAPELIEAIRMGASESYIDPLGSLTEEIAGSHAITQVVNELEPRMQRVGYIKTNAELVELKRQVKNRLIVNREYSDRARIQLRLELTLDDPNISALIVNGLVDRYIEETRNTMINRAHSSIGYYDEMIAEHSQDLDKHQHELGVFEQEHAMLLPEQPFSIQAQLVKTQDDLSMLNTELEGLEIQRRSLQEAIQNEPATLPSVIHGMNPELTRLRLKLEEHQEKIDEHVNKMRMTEQHPQVVALREIEQDLLAKIEQTQENVVTSTQQNPNPKRADLELRLTAVSSERDALKEQIALRRSKIDELSLMSGDMLPVQNEHRKLVAAVNTSQKRVDYYESMRLRAENYLTPESGDRGVQLEFLQRASPHRQPVSPNVFQVVLVAMFMGTTAGALSVFLAHRTDESFRNARQVADATTIPVLGSVSELITRQHRRVRQLRYSIVYPMNAFVMATVLVVFTGLLYLDLERPELFNKIKDRAKSLVQHPTEQGTVDQAPVSLVKPDDPQA